MMMAMNTLLYNPDYNPITESESESEIFIRSYSRPRRPLLSIRWLESIARAGSRYECGRGPIATVWCIGPRSDCQEVVGPTAK